MGRRGATLKGRVSPPSPPLPSGYGGGLFLLEGPPSSIPLPPSLVCTHKGGRGKG